MTYSKAISGDSAGGRGLSHAYILSGPVGSGKHALADRMAANYVCTQTEEAPCGMCAGCRKAAAGIHPDILRAGSGGEIVTVAAARAIRADAYIRPNEAARKVYILENAQNMNTAAQNALLKVLEEGPPYSAFLLLAENDAALLPTIRSRCETIRLAPGKDSEGENHELRDQSRLLVQLLTGGDEISLLTFSISLEKWDRATVAFLLDETVQCLRDKLISGLGDSHSLMRLIEHLRTLRRACDFNIGTGHLAGWLAAGFGESNS